MNAQTPIEAAAATVPPFSALAAATETASGGQMITVRQLAILEALYLNGGEGRVRTLAAQLDITKPVITRCINAFEPLGWARRERDLEDRRDIRIVLTVIGRAAYLNFARSIGR